MNKKSDELPGLELLRNFFIHFRIFMIQAPQNENGKRFPTDNSYFVPALKTGNLAGKSRS